MNTNKGYFDDVLTDINTTNDISRQMWIESMSIALNESEGFGEKRLLRVFKKLKEVEQRYAQVVTDDAKDDKRVIYSKGKRDEDLRHIYGKDFPDHDERYGYNKFVHIHRSKKKKGKKK